MPGAQQFLGVGGVECVIIISRMTEVVMQLNNWEISFCTKVEMICQTLPPPPLRQVSVQNVVQSVQSNASHLVPDSLAALGV